MGAMSFSSCVYLHGFASGPSSSKAKFFGAQLSQLGIPVTVPDLNKPTFAEMTLSSQLEVVQSSIASRIATSEDADDGSFLIVGSSMGGLVATLSAQDKAPHAHQLKALILLAPGFGLPRRWTELLGEVGLKHWKEKGFVDVFHHGANKELPLRYDFYLDAIKYTTEGLSVNVPTLVFHGQRDETVPVEESKEFQRLNPDKVQLEILDDDHQLLASLDLMWKKTQDFISKL